MDDMRSVFAEVDAVRQTLGDRSSFRDPETLRELARQIEGTTALRRQPIAETFLEDIRSYEPGKRLDAVKAHINGRRDGHIFSLFDASYFPKLSLDYLAYEELPADAHLVERYASPTMPVTLTGHSAGFGSRVVVALFPENHIDGIQRPDDLIFYFIDKFVERHNRITRRMIGAVMAEGSFPLIEGASDERVRQASSWWVRLHEYHHRQGDMPIPEFLPAKKYKPLAGLEELRVDVSAMLALLHDERLPREEARTAYEYVLAERLLRYAVEGIPRPNYDAVASQLLFGYLERHEGIRLRGETIELTPEIPAVLAAFLDEIQRIERRIHEEPVEAVRKRLLEFTNTYTDFDPVARDYRYLPFFADVKKKLGV
ncbi:hypothetical protein DVA86_03890 [Streptomyces armeniacus]|uniref:Uncharacterized protein n=1 Tax=Streptomyces armeniacus TaxID=83291 RepID=A0A345XJU5_9ACTN|nr:DUF6421 family protein [Streptomyces armeniacus]AXK31911.1 hypothetical protein DVA86_03890 [Streptomyces armeniacus]